MSTEPAFSRNPTPGDGRQIQTELHIGTAGWSIPRQHAALFPDKGSHLERYSWVLACAEINSSFYRPHRPSTYAHWATSTPDNFRFSVKIPKAITHECALAPTRKQFQIFLDEVRNLSDKLGPLLFQIPPRQSFDETQTRTFLTLFRDLYPDGQAALEPRHPEWFSPEAGRLLREFRMALVIADPAPTSEVAHSARDPGLIYYRLHGSPRVYYSSYSDAWLVKLASTISARLSASSIWCIFDNTASGVAFENALTLREYFTHDVIAPRPMTSQGEGLMLSGVTHYKVD